jgi:predicted Rossmann fold nucleotide-binding protein DprA/Smf involved in DNA uptake
LLSRGTALAFNVEKWINKGIWILVRTDSRYPRRLIERLGGQAPPILYGSGDAELLEQGGLAVVGSRNVDTAGFDFAREVGEHCAHHGWNLVSGGARGVDQSAMAGALNEEGRAVGVLADSLLTATLSRYNREAILQGRLTLVSSCHPEAGFNVGMAMGRNKCIYALADYGLVVSADKGKGGTWSGAVEELRRIGGTPVFVRAEGQTPEGNAALMKLGARPFPARPWRMGFAELLADLAESTPSPEPFAAPARKEAPSRAKPRQMQLFEEDSDTERSDMETSGGAADRIAEATPVGYSKKSDVAAKADKKKTRKGGRAS